MIISFLCAWIFLPNTFRGVHFVQDRFAFFFIPAYILCFVRADGNFPALHRKFIQGFFAVLMLALMFYPLANLYFFRSEADEFRFLLQDIPENKKALMVVDTDARSSKRVKIPYVFVHFPLWYQAIRGGWVDYNTAWAYVAPVRYLPEKLPEVHPGNEWVIDLFSLQQCEVYDLIFIRTNAELDEEALSQTKCLDYHLLARREKWYVFQKK
jgi:hypothetical protein